jgi:hypothetical protein
MKSQRYLEGSACRLLVLARRLRAPVGEASSLSASTQGKEAGNGIQKTANLVHVGVSAVQRIKAADTRRLLG